MQFICCNKLFFSASYFVYICILYICILVYAYKNLTKIKITTDFQQIPDSGGKTGKDSKIYFWLIKD